jgi:antitoxin VapB
MALNIKNLEVERLADEVSRMANESKTEAIRRALEERKARLTVVHGNTRTKEALIEFFERTIWPNFPPEVLGKTLTKREREKILGYGPHGV